MMFDTWAWVEYFKKSPHTQKIDAHIGQTSIFTSVLSLAELACWLERNQVSAPERYVNTVMESSTILGITEEIAVEAGKNLCELRRTAPGLGMIDAIIYTQAACAGMPLLTGDAHFRKLNGIEFVG